MTESKQPQLHKTVAAVKIQSAYRGYLFRKSLKTRHDSALRIQALYRGFRTRSRASRFVAHSKHERTLLKDISQTQRKINNLEKELKELSLANRTRVRLYDLEKRDRAARCIQRFVKGYLLRHKLSRPDSPIRKELQEALQLRQEREKEALIVLQLKDSAALRLSPDEDDVLHREVISSITRRFLKDQFRHETFLESILHSGKLRPDVEDFRESQSTKAQAVVAKLETMTQLLDDYYGPGSTSHLEAEMEPISSRETKALQECRLWRDQTASYIHLMENGRSYFLYMER